MVNEAGEPQPLMRVNTLAAEAIAVPQMPVK